MKRNRVRILILLASATCFFAKVASDFDKYVDFGRYHTYSWISVRAQNPLWNDRIMNAIDITLGAKGWEKVATGGGASINAFGATHTIQTYETWYDGFGGGWMWRRGWKGGGMATTTVERTPVGTLVIDIFDTNAKKLIWRGRISNTLSGKPEKNEEKLRKDVVQLFKNFPPKAKG